MPTKPNPVFLCDGCNKKHDWTAAGGWKCSIWLYPTELFAIRVHGKCPMNYKEKVKKVFQRIGQQKQKGRKGNF
jgi:hypothetical protein